MVDEDMHAIIDSQDLCFATTVTPEGRPTLSPKGTIRVWDERHIYFCDIASPNTRRNIEENRWIEVNVVDLSRGGATASLEKEHCIVETRYSTRPRSEFSLKKKPATRLIPLF
jgi:predicted pyridoxine 5'-phosphate oxidase superfamily flavin-nucleotide-binding protein